MRTTHIFRIGGMTCVNCRDRIEARLRGMAGVESAAVDYGRGTATVAWDGDAVSFKDIGAAVEALGYSVSDGGGAGYAARAAGTLLVILALYMIVRALRLGPLGAAFPLAQSGMGYGMVFVIGLATSLHCAAMCGGINLSQTLRRARGDTPATPPSVFPTDDLNGNIKPPVAARNAPCLNLGDGSNGNIKPPVTAAFAAVIGIVRPGILYNAGRIVMYTIAGVLAGALGGVISVSGRFQGVTQLAAGLFMIVMGLSMLDLIPGLRRVVPRLPAALARRIERRKAANAGPLVVGLLNGFMPCGSLQAMQLYALSTGSAAAGGLSMFLFGIGTVPLMFALGAVSGLLSARFTRTVLKAGAILVTVMGMAMWGYGWNLSGAGQVSAPRAKPAAGAFEPVIENGAQIVASTLSGGRYPAITVRQGVPVRWTIAAPPGSINGCNNRMIIREYGIEHRFTPGDNVIEFLPDKSGVFPYSCWMGMIRSSITVVAPGENAAATGLAPKPAGIVIPTDEIAFAEESGGVQTVAISLRDDGITPAALVVRRGVPVTWTIRNDSLDAGNSRLLVPAYSAALAMKPGDNVIEFLPDADFAFSTADNVFYGYVKVTADPRALDIAALKAEVAQYETLIYPDSYFEPAASAGGCPCCTR